MLQKRAKSLRKYRVIDSVRLPVVVGILFAITGSVFIWHSSAATNPNLKGDLNGDNVVNINDLSILLSSFNKVSSANDLNGDGFVNITDLSILLTNFNKRYTPPPPTPTPSPTPDPVPPTPPTPTPTPPTVPPVPPTPPTADPSDCPNTAGAKLGWGNATYQSDFNNGTTLDPTWHPYGPESGHNGAGTRTPAAITQANGNVVIASDGKGTTGAMKWFPGQRYGRWEVCMKVATGKQHYVLLAWPDAEDWPPGGEIDFAEESGGAGTQSFYLHCPTQSGGNCASASKNNDATQWTAYAVEWTPDHTTGYINGVQFFNDTNKADSAPRPMDLCMQLDDFGNSGADSMTIDWTKQWSIPETQPSTLGLKPGERATGHPNESATKQYAPRPMTVRQMLGLDP